jgi:hypothetical protein
MISAVLIKGGITRQGMAAGLGSDAVGEEFMEDFIADFAAGHRVSRAGRVLPPRAMPARLAE